MDLSFDYTHRNHFKFGYFDSGQRQAWWYRSPPGTENMEWMVEFGIADELEGFRAECHRAAQLIEASTDDIPNIMFSGGMESEVVVRAFRDMRVPFKVSILQFKKNLNLHDIAYAVAFCESREIEYDIIPLDIERFMEHEVYDYCNRTQCPTPQLAPTMWLADQIDGLPILGSGEPYVAKRVPLDYVPGESPYLPSPWYFQEKERIQAWYRHFIQQGRPAVPGFFQYTPELMYEFLTSKMVKKLVANEVVGKLSTVSTKSNIYHRAFSEMTRRPKFHGFEKIMDWDQTVREVLSEGYGQYDRVAEFEYHDFVERLGRHARRI